jgi:hypothetical protein
MESKRKISYTSAMQFSRRIQMGRALPHFADLSWHALEERASKNVRL